MDWLKENSFKLAELITRLSLIKFVVFFTFGTLSLAFIIANFFYNILDALDKAKVLCNDPGWPILCAFLFIWVLMLIFVSTIIFNYGGRLVRYDLSGDRVDALEKSGLFVKSRNRIWLIGYSLLPFANEGWLKKFENKIIDGVQIRLLILDPSTEIAKERVSSIGHINLSDDINDAIRKFKNFQQRFEKNHPTISSNFEIRLYKKNANMSCFILDDEARIGLYLEGQTGLSAPEIRITKKEADKLFFEKIERNFVGIWDSSTKA